MNQEIDSLIATHVADTGHCSFAGHMRRCSTTYVKLIDLGERAVPAILEYLSRNNGGMSVILLLEDILKLSPYSPVKVGGFMAYDVAGCRDAWLHWGENWVSAPVIEALKAEIADLKKLLPFVQLEHFSPEQLRSAVVCRCCGRIFKTTGAEHAADCEAKLLVDKYTAIA